MGGQFFCPVPTCQDATDLFDTPWSLRRHFRDRHPRDFVDVEGLEQTRRRLGIICPKHAVVQAVLLYGSETWVLTASAMRCLEGFYYRAACQVGLYTLTEYIDKRRKTIGAYIIKERSIFDLCRNGERRRGTSSRRWWWDQPINADLESEEDASSVVSEDASQVGSQSFLKDSDGLLLGLLCGDCIALRRCRCSPLDMDDDARKADEDGRAAADSSRVRGR
eukprot:scaffold2657_cov155-Skeletonema_marinoi.AAC.9